MSLKGTTRVVVVMFGVAIGIVAVPLALLMILRGGSVERFASPSGMHEVTITHRNQGALGTVSVIELGRKDSWYTRNTTLGVCYHQGLSARWRHENGIDLIFEESSSQNFVGAADVDYDGRIFQVRWQAELHRD